MKRSSVTVGLKRAIVPGLLLVALYYAVFGGEHSIFELRAARASIETERANLADLRRQIDSLYAWADSLQVDPATIERIAREQFGMIREGETLYRFTDVDSTGVAEQAPAPAR
ncbi:MAG: septum formation initiator family protein [Gemmatimonadetes bacterium]|nr:septum formation initiator family protein [Gemmatimonadota bacterium]MDA1104655.1 septum formation initiator family protein [Gemmatimonadota bacterium]